MSIKERFPHPYKKCFVSLSTDVDLTIDPLQGSTSLLVYCPVSASNTNHEVSCMLLKHACSGISNLDKKIRGGTVSKSKTGG